MKDIVSSRPIVFFLVITFTYTWAVWFSAMLFPNDWALRKIITGMGFGPAIAAIVLSYSAGTIKRSKSKRWWVWFIASFSILLLSYLSMLVTGDAISAEAYSAATPLGFSFSRILLCLASSSLGAFIVANTFDNEAPLFSGFLSWKKPFLYLTMAVLLPSIWLLFGLVISSILGNGTPSVFADLEFSTWLFYSLRSVLFTFFVVAIGEELGWRGWLLPVFQKSMSPLKSSIIIGIIWGLWHFPLYINGGYDEPPHMVIAKVFLCIFLSILFTWIYNRSKGNVMTAIFLHTAMNSSQRFIPATEFMAILMLLTIISLPFIDKMWRKNPID